MKKLYIILLLLAFSTIQIHAWPAYLTPSYNKIITWKEKYKPISDLMKAYENNDLKKFNAALDDKLEDLKNKNLSSNGFLKLINQKNDLGDPLLYLASIHDDNNAYKTILMQTMVSALKKKLITQEDFRSFITANTENKISPLLSQFNKTSYEDIFALINLFLEKHLNKEAIQKILNTKENNLTPIAIAKNNLGLFPSNINAILAHLLPRLFDIHIDTQGIDLKNLPTKPTCQWIEQLAQIIAPDSNNKELVQKIYNKIRSMIIKAEQDPIYMPYIKALVGVYPGKSYYDKKYDKLNLKTPAKVYEILEIQKLKKIADYKKWKPEKLEQKILEKKADVHRMPTTQKTTEDKEFFFKNLKEKSNKFGDIEFNFS